MERNVAFYYVVMLTVSICTLMVCENVYAEVNSQTLESIATPTGISEGVAEIKIGDYPVYIYGDLSESDLIYILDGGDPGSNGTVSVFNTTTNTVIQRITVGIDPTYIYGDLSESDNIYVLYSEHSDTVSVINTSTYDVKDVHVGPGPTHIYGDLSRKPEIYVANRGSDYVSVINTRSNTVIKNITVGEGPNYIYGEKISDNIYVANTGNISNGENGTVSVIDTTINEEVHEIPIGGVPNYISGNLEGLVPRIYVLKIGDDTVSVIDFPDTFSVTGEYPDVTNIQVGRYPNYIYSDVRSGDIFVAVAGRDTSEDTISEIDTVMKNVTRNIKVGSSSPGYIYGDLFESDNIYVAGSGGDTISVLDTTSYDVKNIQVGDSPGYIYGDLSESDALYVANRESGSISLVNSMTNKVLAGVTFDVSPLRAGNVICKSDSDALTSPLNVFLYVSSGTSCIAEPSKGFEFSSWVEVSSDNSTRMITATSGSPWTALLDTLNLKSTDPAANITVNRFGNFAAYFKALPDPLPPEYWASLFTVVATAIVGSLLIPAVIGWTKSKRQTSRLKSFHNQMALAYEDNTLDENDILRLNSLNKNITDSYAAGKLNNDQYTNLKNEVSIAYEEIFKGRIDSQGKSSYGIINRGGGLKEIKEEISDAYSKGKITKLHYDLLNEKISKMTQEKD